MENKSWRRKAVTARALAEDLVNGIEPPERESIAEILVEAFGFSEREREAFLNAFLPDPMCGGGDFLFADKMSPEEVEAAIAAGNTVIMRGKA